MRWLNYALVGRTLCSLLLFESAFMLVPFFTAWSYGEYGDMRAFGVSIAVALTIGLIGHFGIRPSRHAMSKYDGVLPTTLVWVVFSLFGMIPYMLAPTTRMPLPTAFCQAMSGFTTTGVSFVASVNTLSHAIHIWRSLTEWIGGLGIIIFTLALMPMISSSCGVQMFHAEQDKIASGKVSPRISATARRIWGVYILLTAILFALLCFGPMSAFEAACHSFATMSTGGFSTSSDGINSFASVYVKVVITLFMFLGGVNFAMVYRASTGQPRAVVRNEAFLTYCRVILAATFVFIIGIVLNGAYTGWQSISIDPLFQVVSIITSTGFILADYSSWGPTVVVVSLMLMFMGSCAGSSAGGVKIDRVVYLLKFLKNSVKRTLRPNAVLPVRVSDRVVPVGQVGTIVAFICLYAMIAGIGALLLSLCVVPTGDSFVSAVAAMGNASLSDTDSVVGCDYLALNSTAQFILAALMLIGRLEIYSVLVIFSPSFWRR